jgi:hypothetical protein
MADRYAVATGDWNNTATWSTSSGGAPGASFPTSADAAILDATSGSITVTVNVTSACASLTATGYTGTLTFGSVTLTSSGSVTLGSGMTMTGTGAGQLRINSGTMTSNGISTTLPTLGLGGSVTLNTNGTTWTNISVISSGTYTLSSNLQATTLAVTGISAPIFAGAFNISIGTLSVQPTFSATLIFQSGQTVAISTAITAGWSTGTTTIRASTASSSVIFTYSGLASAATLTRIIFTDIDASGGTALDNWYGGTLTRTSGITNRTSADIGGGSGLLGSIFSSVVR